MAMGAERRLVPRYPFVAIAEVMEVRSEARIHTRVSELSMYGCYLDMLNVLPGQTVVRVKISEGEDVFEGDAKIVYAHENLGVGVRFTKVDAVGLRILEKWLTEAERKKQVAERSSL